jgi:hypothetical protein
MSERSPFRLTGFDSRRQNSLVPFGTEIRGASIFALGSAREIPIAVCLKYSR